MRKTIILAIIACTLGIVLLAALAIMIPKRLGHGNRKEQSEAFTGFDIATEAVPSAGGTPLLTDSERSAAGTSALKDTDTPSVQTAASSDALPQDTRPDKDITQTESVPESSGETESPSAGIRRYTDLPSRVREHRIIWVGDSRTLGLRDALHKAERTDDDLFVGKVGEGVRWFRDEGMAQLSDMIAENPDLPVVMNFGVNDPQLINDYVVAYWDVIRHHPDTQFYILSVNPLDEEFLIEDGQVNEAVFDDINSLNVARMNVKLKSEFGSRYIDTASYLKSDGFDTVDGLHFSTETYLKIHDYVVSQLF